jgi:hypothetical protein
MPDQEKNTFLLIADISGYTNFMMKNAKTLSHAQAIITGLMNAVIKEARLPLKIAKLEGDAVFMYAADRGRGTWGADLALLNARLHRLYTAFSRKAEELSLTSEPCGCDACSHVDHLRIKFVAHYGNALHYRLGRFDELAGPDVIALHRLLKNSVEAKEYFLITEAAWTALGFPAQDPLYRTGQENYDDVGAIPVRIRTDLAALRYNPDDSFNQAYSSRWGRLMSMPPKIWILLVTAKRRAFRHLPAETGGI